MQQRLPHLPPIQLPKPLPYTDWKASALDELPNCGECDNTRKIDCPDCNGSGETECCSCGHEHDCEDCDGQGHFECKCTGGTAPHDYHKQIAHDYSLWLERQNFVMPPREIKSLAFKNARH